MRAGGARSGRGLAAVGALCLFLLPSTLTGQESPIWREQRWGVGFTMRYATIPFRGITEPDGTVVDEGWVATLIPLVMFENRWIFLYETEGGVKFVDSDRWRISAMGRTHFFDIPQQYQNQIQGDRFDWGAQLRYKASPVVFADLEALADYEGHAHFNARVGTTWGRERVRLDGWATASYRTEGYNTTFWGLGQERVAGGVDLSARVNGYFHLLSNLYLHGGAGLTRLSSPVRRAPLVEHGVKLDAFLGLGLSNERLGPSERSIENRPYWRLGHNWGTPSALADILVGKAATDPFGSQMSSIFYGHPLTDRLFSAPIEVYLHSGVGWHWKSAYQPGVLELISSIKISYSIPLPWRVRVGFAEGLSLVNEVPAREEENLTEKGYRPSEYLNYLDPSIEISLGDIVPWSPLRGAWLGYYIHHRSAIFETAQQFGRIKGGSNFQGVTLRIEL